LDRPGYHCAEPLKLFLARKHKGSEIFYYSPVTFFPFWKAIKDLDFFEKVQKKIASKVNFVDNLRDRKYF